MSIFFLIVLVFGDRYAIQIDEANSLLLCYYCCEMQTVKAKEAVLVHNDALLIFLLLSSSLFSCFGSMTFVRSGNMLAFDESPRMTVRRFLTFRPIR